MLTYLHQFTPKRSIRLHFPGEHDQKDHAGRGRVFQARLPGASEEKAPYFAQRLASQKLKPFRATLPQPERSLGGEISRHIDFLTRREHKLNRWVRQHPLPRRQERLIRSIQESMREASHDLLGGAHPKLAAAALHERLQVPLQRLIFGNRLMLIPGSVSDKRKAYKIIDSRARSLTAGWLRMMRRFMRVVR